MTFLGFFQNYFFEIVFPAEFSKTLLIFRKYIRTFMASLNVVSLQMFESKENL